MERGHVRWGPVLWGLLTMLALARPSAGAEGASGLLLDGVKSVHVQVDRGIGGGLEGDRLQERIEALLRDAGILVLSPEEYGRFRMSKGYPLARLDVTAGAAAVETGSGTLTLNRMAMVARQKAMLDRNPRIKIMAETWERRMAVLNGTPETLQQHILRWVEEFISDLKAANP